MKSPLSDCRETAGTWASPSITTSSLYISQRLLIKSNSSWHHYPIKQCQPFCYDLLHSCSSLTLLYLLINFLKIYVPALVLLKNVPTLQLLTRDFTLYRETKLQLTSFIKRRHSFDTLIFNSDRPKITI